MEFCVPQLWRRPGPPGDDLMTRGACRGESRCLVVRIVRVIVIRKVAVDACRWRPRKDVVDVTGQAGNRDVRARDREGSDGVVECGARPISSRMTQRAVLREARGLVGRIVRVIVICKVAVNARRWRPHKDIVHVALIALQRQMCSRERKTRRCVLKPRALILIQQ